jgi:hypothetical protein
MGRKILLFPLNA